VSSDRDIDRRIWKLFDGYVHGAITRREFLDRAAHITASGVSAATILTALSPTWMWASPSMAAIRPPTGQRPSRRR
jgi:carboxymethylenebutenolidase